MYAVEALIVFVVDCDQCYPDDVRLSSPIGAIVTVGYLATVLFLFFFAFLHCSCYMHIENPVWFSLI